MAKKRKNFIREKRIYCGEEYLEVDIVAVTNMPEAGKGKSGKSSQAQKNLNDKRSKRRFVQIANTNFGTNDFHISATYNNEHLPMSLEEAEKNVHNYLDRIKRRMKRETGEDLKYMLVTEYTPEEEEGQLTLQGIDSDDKSTKAVRIHHHIIINSGGLNRDDLELMWSKTRINWKKANDPEYRTEVDYYGFVNCDRLQPNENGLEGIVNYIKEELAELNEIVTMYLDYATRQARRHIPMTMEDWKTKLDAFLKFNDAEVLQDKGKVTAAIAKEFAESEFEKYRVIQDSLYESDFDKLMNDMEKDGTDH